MLFCVIRCHGNLCLATSYFATTPSLLFLAEGKWLPNRCSVMDHSFTLMFVLMNHIYVLRDSRHFNMSAYSPSWTLSRIARNIFTQLHRYTVSIYTYYDPFSCFNFQHHWKKLAFYVGIKFCNTFSYGTIRNMNVSLHFIATLQTYSYINSFYSTHEHLMFRNHLYAIVTLLLYILIP